MKIMRYLNIFIFPFILMIAGTHFLQQFLHGMDTGLARSAVYTILGLFICSGIYFLISSSFKSLSMTQMKLGGFFSLFWGLLIGLIVSFCSGVGFGLLKGYSFQFENLLTDLHLRVMGNLFPALCEEVVFRGGIVEGVLQLFGKSASLAAGSLPFGVLHLVGIFFGASVTASQIFGISLAGLMLSLVYLRIGILGGFACHLVWNSFVRGWIKVYGVNDVNAVSALEGSWVTCVVLIAVCIALVLPLKKK